MIDPHNIYKKIKICVYSFIVIGLLAFWRSERIEKTQCPWNDRTSLAHPTIGTIELLKLVFIKNDHLDKN